MIWISFDPFLRWRPVKNILLIYYIYNKHQYMIRIMIILFLFHFGHFQNPFFFFRNLQGDDNKLLTFNICFLLFERHFSFENSPIITQKRHRSAVPAVPWHLAWKDLGIFLEEAITMGATRSLSHRCIHFVKFGWLPCFAQSFFLQRIRGTYDLLSQHYYMHICSQRFWQAWLWKKMWL